MNLALVPIGGTFTMDISEAVEAVLTIKPEIVVPMHRLNSDPKKFKEQVEGLSNVKVVLLNQGEKYRLE